ncbi:phosphoribosylformylglycinamidine synthase subunit PurL [Candidatus Villigracilis affinis]|uniref:phosphoribosylformylglycinamidine synthase subunit PurL n=1 Tax=Candidatus Villigracilis affinis TaxID=3140682 RepID=UPI002A1ED8AB|nr:phosphoribosylformylglycinamidine synthase subunit PurL [Anaerolineales bacterium]
MSIHRFVVRFEHHDPRSAGMLSDARALGYDNLQRIECQDLYFIEGQLSQEEMQQLALKLLSDPVTQTISWDENPNPTPPTADSVILEVSLRPGVTDPVAAEIVRAAHEIGLNGVHRAATGSRFQVTGLNVEQVEQLAKTLLANPVIQHWKIGSIEPSFPEEVESSGQVETIAIRNLSDDELLALSKDRRAALDLAEMQAIRAYCQKENRDLTDVEFETIAQTWSEHCVHKTFKAKVTFDDGKVIDSIIKTYLKSATDKINAPWVISAFVDNAGIIDFDDEFEISFKAETHNHPSAIEPFGGANTGVGGVIRDILGVSAKPIANTDVLCFGKQNVSFDELPEGVLHPKRIMSGVVAGVQDYGNKIGIPTVNGAILFDEGYAANPLVFCGCVGIAPKGLHRKNPQVGDRVIVLGGRTGRDGLRGATFSSMTMDAQTGEVAGASVQIGDPIVEKGLIDVITRARDLRLYNDITDCGAGGLSSAVGEMASTIGCDVELKKVKLKYPGLAPWEIWLSEAQERMVLAVAPENIPALQELCDTFDTELTDIGEITGKHRLIVRYNGNPVVDMDNEFLHEGIPQRQLKAIIDNSILDERISNIDSQISNIDTKQTLLSLLSHPNIASKSSVIRIYDHEIQGGTVVKPLTGVEADAPSDATVLKPFGTKGMKGIVLSNGINPEYGKRDAYHMAFAVIDEAIRNAVAVGADPERIAILDNFCWGDPKRPETLGSLVEAARGCHDAALLFRTPFISGKDSLNNEYLGTDGQRHAIPPTLLISALGIMDDVTKAVTMDLKEAGNALYLIGDFAPVFGGSHFDTTINESIPQVSEITPQVYKKLHNAINAGLIRSAHDLSEGGLAVAAAEMCIGGRLGLDINPPLTTRDLFGETTGCLLVEVSPANIARFEETFQDLPFKKLGQVISDPVLKIGENSIDVEDLTQAFNTPI